MKPTTFFCRCTFHFISFRMGRKKCPHVETIEKRMCAGRESVCPQQEPEQVNFWLNVTNTLVNIT